MENDTLYYELLDLNEIVIEQINGSRSKQFLPAIKKARVKLIASLSGHAGVSFGLTDIVYGPPVVADLMAHTPAPWPAPKQVPNEIVLPGLVWYGKSVMRRVEEARVRNAHGLCTVITPDQLHALEATMGRKPAQGALDALANGPLYFTAFPVNDAMCEMLTTELYGREIPFDLYYKVFDLKVATDTVQRQEPRPVPPKAPVPHIVIPHTIVKSPALRVSKQHLRMARRVSGFCCKMGYSEIKDLCAAIGISFGDLVFTPDEVERGYTTVWVVRKRLHVIILSKPYLIKADPDLYMRLLRNEFRVSGRP